MAKDSEASLILWVDADSCPRPARDLVSRTSMRLSLPLIYVANHQIPAPESPHFTMIVCQTHQDAADDYIVEHARPNDLVITRDIPLAKRLVEKNITVINDRGVVYTEKNISERLSMRNFMMDLYNNGFTPEKTGQYGPKERQEFANAMDREITRLTKLILQYQESARE